MEDVRIGRKTQVAYGEIGLTTAYVIAVPYNPDRTALVLSGHPSIDEFVASEDAPATAQGIMLAHGQRPVIFNIQDHGALVRGPLKAKCASATTVLAWMETILTDK
jgi:hypothetical protein